MAGPPPTSPSSSSTTSTRGLGTDWVACWRRSFHRSVLFPSPRWCIGWAVGYSVCLPSPGGTRWVQALKTHIPFKSLSFRRCCTQLRAGWGGGGVEDEVWAYYSELDVRNRYVDCQDVLWQHSLMRPSRVACDLIPSIYYSAIENTAHPLDLARAPHPSYCSRPHASPQ